MSIQQRAAMMTTEHDKWTVHKLRCMYSKLGIKYKLVQELRCMRAPGRNHARLASKDRSILSLMRTELALDREELIVMVDECVFSKRTFRTAAWSNTNMSISQTTFVGT